MLTKSLLISDFNLSNFAALLKNQSSLDPVLAPYGQVIQVLLQKDLECWQDNYDCIIVWTRPEAISMEFARQLRNETTDLSMIMQDVDNYAKQVLNLTDRTKTVLVPSWVVPTYQRSFGILSMQQNVGVDNALLRMNLRLTEKFETVKSVHLINATRWIEKTGEGAFNPKLWYMGKILFGNEVFRHAAADVKAALDAVSGNVRKLIMLDLDDTLWGGIVGDLGWQNITLGGHDAVGEAYVDFQKTLKAYVNRGILLAIVSKNEEEIAMEAITNHSEMILKKGDFSGWRINWEDKAVNILELAQELNLGLESVVFIDDNPFERARVREALPQVLVPEWPNHPLLYKSAFLDLSCFDAVSVTDEDTQRSKMYHQEARRKTSKTEFKSIDEWIKDLGICVSVDRLDENNSARVAQIFNKTNQMNLATRRISEAELKQWVISGNHEIFAFRVRDKFGDYGLTGIVSLVISGECCEVVDFILSCRVMGRCVEETMLHTLTKYAKNKGACQIVARYQPTEKNKPCLEFWKRSGFSTGDKDFTFYWDLDRDYALVEGVQLEGV